MPSPTFLVSLVVLSFVTHSTQNIQDNEIDSNPFEEAAKAIFKEQNAQNIGGLVNSFINSGGAKQIGDMLGGGNAGQLLQGLGSLMGGGGEEGGLDPALIGNLMGMLAQTNQDNQIPRRNDGSNMMNDILSIAGSFLNQPNDRQGNSGGAPGLLEFLPMIIQTMGAFTGPEASKRADSHSDHAWLMPPLLEKIHVLYDHFAHSDMAKKLLSSLGADKMFKIFSDENGQLSYVKFVEKMENHSFRRHWIRVVTDRIATLLSYATDPQTHSRYLSNVQFFFNNFIKSQGFPKAAMFDQSRPTESISVLVNHIAKRYFEIKIDSKQYVKPAVEYLKELMALAQTRSKMMSGSKDSKLLSDKLTDTLNLEIIEPIARVNRAYRFAKAVPKCEKYVFCLINEENQNEVVSLPGLKKALYRGSSLIAGWFLSSHTGTPYWDLYEVIIEDIGCKKYYMEACHNFHIEEEKVTTEYVHTEL